MDLSWFQMTDVRRKKLDTAVWIPLRAIDKVTHPPEGEFAYLEIELVDLQTNDGR